MFIPSPLTPSNTFFSKIHTLTSLFVVLCVALTTFQRPTVTALAEDVLPVAGRLVDELAGDGPADVCSVYADKEDDFPKRFDATANILLSAPALYEPGKGGVMCMNKYIRL